MHTLSGVGGNSVEMNHNSERLVSAEYLRLQKQIQISLKFHHREVIEQLPRELALQAMNEAWCDSAKAYQG
jgi:hypothetical protein